MKIKSLRKLVFTWNYRIAFLICILMFLSLDSSAQNADADFFQSIGKIYVVVAVVVAIFIGLILFMWNLERRIKKLENQIVD